MPSKDMNRHTAYEEIQALEKKLESDPENVQLLFELGEHRRNKDDLNTAIELFDKVITVDPEYFPAHIECGLSYLDLGEPSKAIERFQKGADLRPKSPIPHLFMGLAYDQVGETDKAIKHLNNCIRLNPEFVTAYECLGRIYRQKGEMGESISYLEKAHDINPEDPRIIEELGATYFIHKKPVDDSIAAFQKAEKLDPQSAGLKNNLGFLHMHKGELDKAEKKLNEALSIEPHKVITHQNLGFLFSLKKDHNKAVAKYEDVIKSKSNSAMDRATLNIGLEDKDFASRFYVDNIVIKAAAHINLGGIYLLREEPDNARAQFHSAIAVDKEGPAEAYRGVALSYSSSRDMDLRKSYEKRYNEKKGIVKKYEKPKRRGALQASQYMSLGIHYFKEKRADDSIAAFEKAEKLNPKSADVKNNLGFVYMQKGELDKAEKKLNEALSIEPNKVLAHQNLGFLFSLKRDHNKAAAKYEEVIGSKKEPAMGHATLNVALTTRDFASRFYVDDIVIKAAAHINLGGIYLLRKEPDNARAQFHSAIAVDKEGAVEADRGLALSYSLQGDKSQEDHFNKQYEFAVKRKSGKFYLTRIPPEAMGFRESENTLKITAEFEGKGRQERIRLDYEKGDEAPRRCYSSANRKDIEHCIQKHEAACAKILSERDVREVRRDIAQLRETGKILYKFIFNEKARLDISKGQAENLWLRLSTELAGVNWELLHDEENFLGMQYNVCRHLIQAEPKRQVVSTPIDVRIFACPIIGEDEPCLPGTIKEALLLTELLREHEERGSVTYTTYVGIQKARLPKLIPPLTEELITKIQSYAEKDKIILEEDLDWIEVSKILEKAQVVHFAAHSFFDGKENVIKLGPDQNFMVRHIGEAKSCPKLVFLNSCKSGVKSGRTAGDIARAFLEGGVENYIGTFWDIDDEAGAKFALLFYKEMLMHQQATFSSLITKAKKKMHDEDDAKTWISYMLYGRQNASFLG